MHLRVSCVLILSSFIITSCVVINIEEKSDSDDSFDISESSESEKLTAIESKVDKILKWTDKDDQYVIYQGCPNGWVTFYNSCYLFGGKKVNFNAAKAFCSARDSYMVVVETRQENEFLKSFMETIEGEQNNTSYWLGLTENVLTDQWVWQHGGKVALFTDWGPSEPDPAKNEGCVWFEQHKGYKWSDVVCQRETRTLCEKRHRIME